MRPPRSTWDELRHVGGWATGRSHTGIGRGWFGWAWVWLHLVCAGLAPDDARARRTIARRLRREPPAASPLVGAMVGGAAGPTVAALLAHIDPAAGPLLAEQVALWRRACRGEHGPDFLDGAAGALVAAAEIDALCPGTVGHSFAALLHGEVSAALRAHLSPPRGDALVYLGLAHGIAGFLLALEVGRAAFGLPLRAHLRSRAIDHLMAARLRGPGNIAGWPVAAAAEPLVPNAWCNGTAGVALVALAGQRLSGDPAYEQLVDVALPSTFALRGGPFAAFCCGTIGQAQIMLEAHRLLGDRSWLSRARRTADLAALPRAGNRTFNQGVLGGRYLELRIAHPGRLPLPGLGGLSAPV